MGQPSRIVDPRNHMYLVHMILGQRPSHSGEFFDETVTMHNEDFLIQHLIPERWAAAIEQQIIQPLVILAEYRSDVSYR